MGDTLNEKILLAATPAGERAGDDDGGEQQTALCLSGGGYRAMLFHLGALLRLNELGWLPRIGRFSSVSGGSITAAVLALHWRELAFDPGGVASNLRQTVIEPVRNLARLDIDAKAILKGALFRGSISDKVAAAYDKHLFKGATLQDLPDEPRFVINATNVQSRSLFRFSKPYIWDWRVGKIDRPKLPLAKAVAASSAFPPFLSPCTLKFEESDWVPDSGAGLQRPPFTTEVVLTDGGVYDNLGLETAWKRAKTILVSDGGGTTPEEPEPDTDWARHSYRVLNLVDFQVRSLRKRQLIAAYELKQKAGAYWGIRTDIANYSAPGKLPAPVERTLKLADTPTRLSAIDDSSQERIINWGYAVSDAAVRTHIDPALPAPERFPYPAGV